MMATKRDFERWEITMVPEQTASQRRKRLLEIASTSENRGYWMGLAMIALWCAGAHLGALIRGEPVTFDGELWMCLASAAFTAASSWMWWRRTKQIVVLVGEDDDGTR